MKNVNAVAYYPGCSLHGMSRQYDSSNRLVCEHIGLKLLDIPNWNCCGATSAHTVDQDLNLAINARNLHLACKTGAEVLVAPCSACFSNLKKTLTLLKSGAVRQKIIELPEAFEDDIEVMHFSELFVLPEIVAKVRQKIVRNFGGLKVACYYGCLTVRPFHTVQFDNSENPMSLDNLLKMTGVNCIDWSHKTECCGASFAVCEPKIVDNRTEEIINQALEAGAEAFAVACPLCHTNLEMSLHRLRRLDIPVVFFTQLLGHVLQPNQEPALLLSQLLHL